jgi:hypothetical protein
MSAKDSADHLSKCCESEDVTCNKYPGVIASLSHRPTMFLQQMHGFVPEAPFA